MATLMAGIKGTDGKFYQKAVDWDKRGRPIAPKPGTEVETAGEAKFEVAEVTRYFVVSREMRDGKYRRIQTGSFATLDEAQIEMLKVQAVEKSRKLAKDFTRHVVDQPTPEPAATEPVDASPETWQRLVEEYLETCRREVVKGNLKESTVYAYNKVIRYFTAYLSERKVSKLSDITSKLIEEFKVAKIKAGSKQAHVIISKRLNPIFELAVTSGWIVKNPVKYDSPRDVAARGAMPYSTGERNKLETEAEKNPFTKLAYWLLIRTGMRRSDAIKLQWWDINGHIAFAAIKNGKKVRLPILPDLQLILDAERSAAEGSLRDALNLGKADDSEYVVLNPATKRPFSSGDNFYEYVADLGADAKVKAYPHRFRDTFAADCFLKGLDVSEVAFYLGDSVKTVERHYAEFINERKDRADAKLLGRKIA